MVPFLKISISARPNM